MNEIGNRSKRQGFSSKVMYGLGMIYIVVIIVSVIWGGESAPLLAVPLGIIWVCQFITIGDGRDVDEQPEAGILILQSIGLGLLGAWISIIWLPFIFDAIQAISEDPTPSSFAFYAIMAFIFAAVASYLANRGISRYQFVAGTTVFAALGLLPALLDMWLEFYDMDRFGKWADVAALYMAVIPVWSVAPIAYLIRFHTRYRAYRRALFEPGYQLHAVRMATDRERYEEVEE